MAGPWPEIVACLERVCDFMLNESRRAASHGDWERARVLMDLAERADLLRKDIAVPQGLAPATPPAGAAPGSPAKGSPAADPLLAEDVYPKFFTRDDALVKRGLKRDGTGEVYEHAVPREQYDQILDRLSRMAATFAHGKQRPFSIEKIQAEVDCPRYMTYVVVSMLLRAQLLIRARKGSYTFTAPGDFAGAAAKLWDRLKGADI